MRLLIVEDSALIRKVTHLAFPGRAHDLHEAENGRQALQLLQGSSQPFDVIVLDLRMPEMNGVEFIAALRKDRLHGRTPIVVASSEGETSELLKAVRQLGVAAILKKPWKPQELARVVQEVGEAKAGARRSSRRNEEAP